METFNIDTYHALSKVEATELYTMFKHLHHILTKYGIEYWSCGGTMLGALRSGGLIKWDDDVDICIDQSNWATIKHMRDKLEYIPFDQSNMTKSQYITARGNGTLPRRYHLNFVGKYCKLQIGKGKVRVWIDIFKCGITPDKELIFGAFPQKHYAHWWMTKDEILPLRKLKFGDFEINVPNKCEELCEKHFPKSMEIADVYNHQGENGAYKKWGKYKLTPEANKPYEV